MLLCNLHEEDFFMRIRMVGYLIKKNLRHVKRYRYERWYLSYLHVVHVDDRVCIMMNAPHRVLYDL
jgi:hypothetical protein